MDHVWYAIDVVDDVRRRIERDGRKPAHLQARAVMQVDHLIGPKESGSGRQ